MKHTLDFYGTKVTTTKAGYVTILGERIQLQHVHPDWVSARWCVFPEYSQTFELGGGATPQAAFSAYLNNRLVRLQHDVKSDQAKARGYRNAAQALEKLVAHNQANLIILKRLKQAKP